MVFDFLDVCCQICHWNKSTAEPCKSCMLTIKHHKVPVNFISKHRLDIWCRKCIKYKDCLSEYCQECAYESDPDYRVAPMHFERSHEFAEWCDKCKHTRLFEHDDPCDKCRLDKDIPTAFEERNDSC